MISGALAKPVVKMTMVIHHKETGRSFDSPEKFNRFVKRHNLIKKIKGVF